MADSAYSFSLTTFNPSGKLLQIEYALNAVNNNGRTSLGIRAKNGVVIATEKKLPTVLVDEDAYKKIEKLSTSAGLVYSGLGPDYRVLVRKARKKAQAYYMKYKVATSVLVLGLIISQENAPASILVREIAAVMQEFTQSGGVRPFGVSLLYAGFDEDGPQLYQIDPSGSYFGWKATAIGKDSVSAKSFLEKRYNDEMELEDAINTALKTMREGFEGEMNETNIEVGIIGEDKIFRVLSPNEVKDYLAEAE
ncbi:threonine protease family T01A [Achlya hypogyna]|uniref:Threonine protease family T01A n=1 Tax=Achlya hypogyna TaxID=1202772 RepID=A0A1V9ZM95_ACHHY|nr:threonine protease family T01A [Achlya hypogyna]